MATKTIKTPAIMEKILKHALFILPFLLNNNLCPLKGHTYLNKPAAFSCKFV